MTDKPTHRCHLVMGMIGTGKTTFIDGKWPVGEAIRVHLGKFFREAVGIEVMQKDDNPNACLVTERWVRRIVIGAMETSMLMPGKDIVFDGFPRTAAQLSFLVAEMEKQPKPLPFHVWDLQAADREARISGRGESEFDRAREQFARRDYEGVQELIRTLRGKRFRNQGKYPKIIIKSETVNV